MIVLEYDSTVEHSSLRIAEYTQHTEDTAHIIYLLYHIYLVCQSAYTLNILTQKNMQSLKYVRSMNMETYVL